MDRKREREREIERERERRRERERVVLKLHSLTISVLEISQNSTLLFGYKTIKMTS